MLHNLIFETPWSYSSNIFLHCHTFFLPTRKSQENPMDTARWDPCCSSSKRAMIHEAGSPVPGAGRNSWHYLLQMGLKMLLARLTRALIYSSRCTERLGSLSQHRYEPPPPLRVWTRTQTQVYTHTSPLQCSQSVHLQFKFARAMYLEEKKREK